MPDSGSERGRGTMRATVASILADAAWTPAETPHDATRTARDARELAVRLRPVLSRMAQQTRSRRRDQEWLSAVEQLAVDAQYFASWWLPRLEGKSAQSWPSWSADGFADWVKRLEAQRRRTLEIVEAAAPQPGRMASVTPLRPRSRGRDQEAEDLTSWLTGQEQNPGQQFPGQQFPGQQFPGQQFPGQQFPGQPFPGQYPGQPGPAHPVPGRPQPGQAIPAQGQDADAPSLAAAAAESADALVTAAFDAAFEREAGRWGAPEQPSAPREEVTDEVVAEPPVPEATSLWTIRVVPNPAPADLDDADALAAGHDGHDGHDGGHGDEVAEDGEPEGAPAEASVEELPRLSPTPDIQLVDAWPEDLPYHVEDEWPTIPHQPPIRPADAPADPWPSGVGEEVWQREPQNAWPTVPHEPPNRPEDLDSLPDWARTAIRQDFVMPPPPPPRLIPQMPPMAPRRPVGPPAPRPDVPRVPPNGPPGGPAAGALLDAGMSAPADETTELPVQAPWDPATDREETAELGIPGTAADHSETTELAAVAEAAVGAATVAETVVTEAVATEAVVTEAVPEEPVVTAPAAGEAAAEPPTRLPAPGAPDEDDLPAPQPDAGDGHGSKAQTGSEKIAGDWDDSDEEVWQRSAADRAATTSRSTAGPKATGAWDEHDGSDDADHPAEALSTSGAWAEPGEPAAPRARGAWDDSGARPPARRPLPDVSELGSEVARIRDNRTPPLRRGSGRKVAAPATPRPGEPPAVDAEHDESPQSSTSRAELWDDVLDADALALEAASAAAAEDAEAAAATAAAVAAATLLAPTEGPDIADEGHGRGFGHGLFGGKARLGFGGGRGHAAAKAAKAEARAAEEPEPIDALAPPTEAISAPAPQAQAAAGRGRHDPARASAPLPDARQQSAMPAGPSAPSSPASALQPPTPVSPGRTPQPPSARAPQPPSAQVPPPPPAPTAPGGLPNPARSPQPPVPTAPGRTPQSPLPTPPAPPAQTPRSSGPSWPSRPPQPQPAPTPASPAAEAARPPAPAGRAAQAPTPAPRRQPFPLPAPGVPGRPSQPSTSAAHSQPPRASAPSQSSLESLLGPDPTPTSTPAEDLNALLALAKSRPPVAGTAGPPNLPSTPAQTADVGRMVRYILFAVLVLVGVTLMITSLRGGSSSPSADATPSGPPAATPAKSGGAVVAPPGASASQHPSPAGPATATASSDGGGGSGGGAVTSVEITALTPDHPGSKAYIAHLHVLTNGPGPVTVTLTVAGSTIVGLPGSVQTRTFPIILSGQTTYDYAKVLDADSFCPAPYLGVKASAPGVSSSYKATTSAC